MANSDRTDARHVHDVRGDVCETVEQHDHGCTRRTVSRTRSVRHDGPEGAADPSTSISCVPDDIAPQSSDSPLAKSVTGEVVAGEVVTGEVVKGEVVAAGDDIVEAVALGDELIGVSVCSIDVAVGAALGHDAKTATRSAPMATGRR